MEVCHIMKISVAESNPDVGLSLTQRTFPLSPDVLATDRHNQMPVMTMSIVSLISAFVDVSQGSFRSQLASIQ